MMNIRELRTFATVVGLGFLALGGVSWFTHRRDGVQPLVWVLWSMAGAIMLVGLTMPRALGPFHRVWTTAGKALGWVNARIILGTIYFGLMTPVAIVLRLCGRDVLRIRGRRSETLWVRRDATRPASESYPRMF